MGPQKLPQYFIKVDQGVMAMKVSSTRPRALELKLHHQMLFCHIARREPFGGFPPT